MQSGEQPRTGREQDGWAEIAERWLRRACRRVFELDVRSLALLRVTVGLVVLGDFLTRAFDVTSHYSDRGIFTIADSHRFLSLPYTFSIFDLARSPAAAAVLFAIAIGCALLLLVGAGTRVATVAVWAFLVSVQNRNPLVLHGGDVLLRVVVFWCMFLPLGACFSVDAWRRRRPVAARTLSIGTVGLVLQIAFVYLFLADQKLLGFDWEQGTAVQYALSLEEIRRPLANLVLGHPLLLRETTFAVIAAQFVIVVGLLSPFFTRSLRTAAVVIGVSCQLSFGVFLSLGTFPYVASAAMLGFVPPEVWEALARRFSMLKLPETGEGPSRSTAARIRRGLVTGFGALCLWAIFLVNIGHSSVEVSIGESRVDGSSFTALIDSLRLDQFWSMFAPNVDKNDGWFVIDGTLSDGSHVDVLRALLHGNVQPGDVAPKATENDGKPTSISGLYDDHRWSMALRSLAGPPAAPDSLFRELGNYACTVWNDSSNTVGRRIVSVAIVRNEFTHEPGGKTTPIVRRVLVDMPCGKNLSVRR